MDYKELTFRLINSVWKNPGMTDAQSLEWDAADAITDLLARAEAVEYDLEQKEGYYHQMVDALAAVDSKDLEESKEKLKAAEARAEKAERERDAAIQDIS